MLRWLTAGESHGPALVAIAEGLPAGIETSTKDIAHALARRRLGYGRGARMKFEQDEVTILGGLRHGLTQGGPFAVQIGNSEWPKWRTVMAADPAEGDGELDELEPGTTGQARSAPLTRPRPGHADLAGIQKYGFTEARPVLERASARETAARVALGEVARAFLKQAAGVELVSHVVELGPVKAPAGLVPQPSDEERLDADPVRCLDAVASARMVEEIDLCHKEGDTMGGVVEVLAYGLPPGLGSHVHWDRRLDARLAAALMGIQAIKGVELGDGFELARVRGSQAQDEIVPGNPGVHRATGESGGMEHSAAGPERSISRRTNQSGGMEHSAAGPERSISRRTNKSGGTEGGMSTGEVLRVRAAMKPISTIPRALATVDVATGESATAHHQRSDVCAVPAAGIVAEAMVAMVLADALLEKFGGDSVPETRRNIESYLAGLDERGLGVH
ncbi:chorismate synthase [Actinospica sp. MGRD01-02]|uniref:Chorismate synthase n=1 Tax=Actinospica acidithermotolerans TaxID=2828514 RepID=A0A941EJ04_9ACTN|nr:chorismate synthase [Actinospica acidithermotolerans]MBR7831288.1 chorismate synthase [Actinospica acidithermotolerans]